MGNIIGGFVAIALGILAAITWKWRVLDIIQGLLPLFLIGGGIIAVIAGWEVARDTAVHTTEYNENEEKIKCNE